MIAQPGYSLNTMINLGGKGAGSDKSQAGARGGVKGADGQQSGTVFHGMLAVARAEGLPVDDDDNEVITSAQFKELRRGIENWSDTTLGLELRALVVLGILKPVEGKPGTYTIVVKPTEAQLDAIHEAEQEQEIVYRGRNTLGKEKGLFAHRVDEHYFSLDTINELRDLIGTHTGVDLGHYTGTATAVNGVAMEELASRAIPPSDDGAAVEITANRLAATGRTVVANLMNVNLVTAGDVDDANVANHNVTTEVQTVLFKGSFVKGDPSGFAAAFNGLEEDQIAVVMSTAGDQEIRDIVEALQDQEDDGGQKLIDQVGNRIVILSLDLTQNRTVANALADLFMVDGEDSNWVDLQNRYDQPGDLLNDQSLLQALGIGV